MSTTTGITFRYSLIQRLLHWLIALLAILMLGIGLTIGTLEHEGMVATFGQDLTNTIYTYHKSFGVLLLGLMVLRVLLRVTLGAPPYRQPLVPWQLTAAKAVHGLLYLVLLAIPVVGWLATAAEGFPVQFFDWQLPGLIGEDKPLGEALFDVHSVLAWILIALIVMHVGAALMHRLIQRDGVMERMPLLG
jgi:cytochrome b561